MYLRYTFKERFYYTLNPTSLQLRFPSVRMTMSLIVFNRFAGAGNIIVYALRDEGRWWHGPFV